MDDRYPFREIEAKWQERWVAEQTFRASHPSEKPKFYGLEMFPYPSGAGLSVGHLKNYVPTDACCRYKSMQGFNVLRPMGWDAFGQPAENEAIRAGRNPRDMVPEYSANYRRALIRAGCTYDWDREIDSSLPEYYRWTQWIFLLLYRRGLAYRATAPINWCPSCKTGLANEEVKDGRCWRCDTPIEKRPMPQWYFRITAYADRLLADLDTLDWPEGIKQSQRDWIGRSEGADVTFEVGAQVDRSTPGRQITVFTTRPDTLFGATFMVLAPEHPLVETLTTADRKAEVDDYVRRARQAAEIERLNTERARTGVFTGAFAVNPVNNESIPIWIADYVLMGYGTGAIMAVPAHDQRDFEFARTYDLPIRLVFQVTGGLTTPEEMTEALPHGGVLINSDRFNGLPNSKETIGQFIARLTETGKGEGRVNYRLRDWLISRQRYWGTPIPIVHCARCGEVPVPEEQLPVLLPDVDDYAPPETGESPLATIPEFVQTTCPTCGGPAHRETDTMGTFACSSWYFLRFADPHNDREFAAREAIDYWLPVDLYVGGTEHTVGHLLYARFWTKVLHDAGLIGFQEPFQTLRNQGQLLVLTPGRRPRPADGGDGGQGAQSEPGAGHRAPGAANAASEQRVVDWIVLKPEERDTFPADQVVWRWARMSKSRGNAITPEAIADKHGADSLRTYILFVVPFEETVQWTEEGITGASRFLGRVWRWAMGAFPSYEPRWRDFAGGATDTEGVKKIRRKLHQTIRKVGEDIEGFRFNTAIAALMELVNDLYVSCPIAPSPRRPVAPSVLSEALETLTLLLAPFAPHMADELWERMGKAGSTYHAAWPAFDPAVAAEEEITLVVQVNGRVRDRLTVPADASDDLLKQQALASTRVTETLAGRTIRNVVVVPGKLVNIVTDSAA
jgi:leucyl-tRNA synthetase